MATAELLLHPVRWRIVQAFLGDRVLTTAELGALLEDVPTATLYRQVGVLARAGLLEVVAERRVRGASERSYRLVPRAAALDGEALAAMDGDAHRRAFAAFTAGLLADFDRYLGRAADPPDLAADRVGYRQASLWLTDEEFDALAAELAAAVQARLHHAPEGRRRRLLTTIALPAG